MPVLRERTQQRTLRGTEESQEYQGSWNPREKIFFFFLERGVMNINKCKCKVKMTQARVCLLHYHMASVDTDVLKWVGQKVRLVKFRYEW